MYPKENSDIANLILAYSQAGISRIYTGDKMHKDIINDKTLSKMIVGVRTSFDVKEGDFGKIYGMTLNTRTPYKKYDKIMKKDLRHEF